MTLKIFIWKVNFSSSRNFLKGSTFPAIPFHLVQFMDFKTLRAQFSVSSRLPPNSFNISENIKTKILMLHNVSCWQPNCIYRHCIDNFFLDCKRILFILKQWNVRSCVPKTEKTIKVLISKMQSFAWIICFYNSGSNGVYNPSWYYSACKNWANDDILRRFEQFLGKRFGPLFFNKVFHKFIDVRLMVNFGCCFENFSRAFLALWSKAYLPI